MIKLKSLLYESEISDKVKLLISVYERIMKDTGGKAEPARAMQMATKIVDINPLRSKEERVIWNNFHSYIVKKLAQ